MIPPPFHQKQIYANSSKKSCSKRRGSESPLRVSAVIVPLHHVLRGRHEKGEEALQFLCVLLGRILSTQSSGHRGLEAAAPGARQQGQYYECAALISPAADFTGERKQGADMRTPPSPLRQAIMLINCVRGPRLEQHYRPTTRGPRSEQL